MRAIHSSRRQAGFTLVELMIYAFLGLVVMLGAGAVHRGVDRSFKTGAHKVIAQQEASLLSNLISRRARIASGFMIYNVPNRTIATNSGDGLALQDIDGEVIYRFEWDDSNMTLADSTGARVTALSLASIQFDVDTVAPKTVRYSVQADDETGNLVDIESAVALRN